jgi:Domain of unknown function (DUF4476)
MKTLSILLVSFLTSLSVFAQNIVSTVTIQVNGNRNRQVIVDGKTYSMADYTNTSNGNSSTPVIDAVTITDLQPGQHTLQVWRTSQDNSNRRKATTTTFNIRSGYDMLITVNGDGSVQLKESRKRGNRRIMKTPMSDPNFTVLLQNVQRQGRSSSRKSLISNAFANTNNYFTTLQATQLIQSIRTESGRLQLAKSSYRSIVDPANFTQVYDLLSSQTSKDELAAYVSSYNHNNPVYNNNGNTYNNQYRTAMSDASFNLLVQDVQKQWQSNAKVSLLMNAFANTNNYFTTAQAGQLISLVSSEKSRLQLAKASYRSITDPVNFTHLYELLNSQSGRNELAAYVSTYNGNNSSSNNNNGNTNNSTYRSAMSDANFNIVIQDIQKQWLPGAKMSALINTFANTNNYFTTSQTKQLIQLISDESNRLQLAKASYRTIVDPGNFTQLYDLLNSQASRNELAAYVSNYNTNNSTANNNNNYGNTNNYQYKTPMSDANFSIVMQDVQKQWLPGAKVSTLANTFANTSYYFTTYQAKQLIQLINDESNRLQLAKDSYRTIVDPNNFTQLYDLLTSQASRNELAAYVSNYNSSNSTYNNNGNTNTYQYKTAMSDANYSTLIQQVESQWLPGAKMSALTNIFANTGYYFTTSQAKQLINYVSDESNRLQLAKSSYRGIVDPVNFTQLYDLLSSQASKDELTAYVNSYR